MARLETVTYTDDLDGSNDDVKTVMIGVDDKVVEIDLGRKNRSKLDGLLRDYFQKGRVPERKRGRPKGSTAKSGRGAPKQAAYDRPKFLEWAAANKIDPGQRRPKTELLDRFLAETGGK